MDGYNVFAAPATISLTIDNSIVGLDIVPKVGQNGTFMSSSGNTISAWTNNATGYTLKIVSSAHDDANKYLVNSEDDSERLTSIKDPAISSNFIVGEWGYLPNQYYDNKVGYMIDNTGSDPYFLPAPDSIGDVLGVTTASNVVGSLDSYTIAVGAKIDQATRAGIYRNTTFIVQLVANTVPYSITYVDNIVSNMPVDMVGNADGTTVTISSNVPKRNGYKFLGWCTVNPVVNLVGLDTCSGTTIAAGGTVSIDQLGGSNDYILYAMWGLNEPVNDNIYMQNVNEWGSSLGVGQEVMAIDARDGKTYTVARLCMSTTVPIAPGSCVVANSKLWMTQNLDLIVGPEGVATLDSTSSDINVDLGTAQGYNAANDIIVWKPNSTLDVPAIITNYSGGTVADAVVGWVDDNDAPYQVEGGNYYIYASENNNYDTIYSSRFACVAAGHSDAECHHYHIGNYYNWNAAVAINTSSAYMDDLYAMPNSICPAGWRLPNGLAGENGNETITESNQLALAYGATTGTTTLHNSGVTTQENVGWTPNGFYNWRTSPLYFIRSGFILNSTFYSFGIFGYLWSGTSQSRTMSYYTEFYQDELNPAYQYIRAVGFPIRCVAR